jgi:hypothetical protein
MSLLTANNLAKSYGDFEVFSKLHRMIQNVVQAGEKGLPDEVTQS